ncbi:LOW QUALITY PROTEIN: olfactory receptor 141-like [Meriones unguiculatus]|uniref:LOW QUALITY PROTEIN: olfactory receptor 141-like n=1 Tax=Meriones unguiculatus TaxID=10047 RepID=UPI000B4FBC62|nr:LOW QUALITY PROTEIN: olfactory receptor 141-like [Meriones unguiculatus]
MENVTDFLLFILRGLPDNAELQIVLFVLFLVIYLFTLMGNGGLIAAVIGNTQLHNPKYYLLGVLSFIDACFSTIITPKILIDFMSEKKVISFLGCAAQMFLAVSCGTTECFLLAAMAYDRYEAIYNPLLYAVSMSPRVYISLIIGSLAGGILHAPIHTAATASLSFCGSNEMKHFFCDIPPLLAISCSDTKVNELILFIFVSSIEEVTILIIIISSSFILFAILKIHSAEGRQKVSSTCGSHLIGVSIYYETILFMYMRPSSSYALEHDMVVSTCYAIVIPMLNPIIYSLRNRDVKEAMRKLLRKMFMSIK